MIDIIILAIVQGIAEFLPISSSAHLIIFRDIFNIGSSINESIAFTFDIALHFGTLLAIIVYFFKDLLNMVIKGLTKPKKEGRLLWFLAIATIPAAIFGFLFDDIIESFARKNYLLIALALIIMGIVIYIADKKSENKKKLDDISLKDAILIGLAQVLALVPGFSRSGTTIAASRFLKIERENSAKFSFYLSLPIVFGAVILSLFKDNTISLIINNLNIFIIGILVSFMVGLLCIEFLLKYLKKNNFKIFMIYRVILGISVIISLLI